MSGDDTRVTSHPVLTEALFAGSDRIITFNEEPRSQQNKAVRTQLFYSSRTLIGGVRGWFAKATRKHTDGFLLIMEPFPLSAKRKDYQMIYKHTTGWFE